MTNRTTKLPAELASAARLLSTKECADLLGITTRALDANLQRGTLPGCLIVRVGGSKRVRYSKLLEWLDSAGENQKATAATGQEEETSA